MTFALEIHEGSFCSYISPPQLYILDISFYNMADLETNKNTSKEDVQYLEVTEGGANPNFGLGQSDEKPFTGVRRLLKRNPSIEFCREVAKMNEEELDPAEVKKVPQFL